MSKRVTPLVPAVSVGLFVAVIVLGADRTAVAADDCLAGPDRPPAPGGHWYYHLDHASDRKCWYLVEPGARAPTAEAVQPQPAPEPPPQPGFGALFSTLSAGFSGPTTAQPATPDARSPQPAPADDLKNTEAAPARDLHPAHRPAAVAALAPKPHQSRPPLAHPDERAPASSDQAERDALFQEFLRWREHRTPPDTARSP
jgi:hypothetical protein